MFAGEIQLEAGLKDLRVLKTTQSAFVNFVNDDYRSLPDAKDRVFSTSVYSRWIYSDININFCKIWQVLNHVAILPGFSKEDLDLKLIDRFYSNNFE